MLFRPLFPALLAAALALPLAAEPLTETQMSQWRQRIRQTFSVPDPLPALDAKIHGEFSPEPGVRALRVSYSTQLGMRVPAIVYLPQAPKGKIPGLIIVNGHGGDKFSWYPFYAGVIYARGGAAVLTYDPNGEGERNPDKQSGTRAHDKLPVDAALARQQAGLMMTDLMQAVSYLSSLPEVDPTRLAAMGYSMGSFVTAITGAVETRLKACVLVGGGNLDGPDEYWDNSKPMCQGIPYRSLDFLGDRPAVLYAMHASRGPTLMYNGLADTVVRIPTHDKPFFADLQKRVTALVRDPATVFEAKFEPDISHRPFFVTKPVALWLEKHLDFPNWSEQELQNLPTTKIIDWATRHHIEMDPGYNSEDREGGTPGLGSNIPGFERNQLNVFSDEEWNRRKDELLIESWVRKAQQSPSVLHPSP